MYRSSDQTPQHWPVEAALAAAPAAALVDPPYQGRRPAPVQAAVLRLVRQPAPALAQQPQALPRLQARPALPPRMQMQILAVLQAAPTALRLPARRLAAVVWRAVPAGGGNALVPLLQLQPAF